MTQASPDYDKIVEEIVNIIMSNRGATILAVVAGTEGFRTLCTSQDAVVQLGMLSACEKAISVGLEDNFRAFAQSELAKKMMADAEASIRAEKEKAQ